MLTPVFVFLDGAADVAGVRVGDKIVKVHIFYCGFTEYCVWFALIKLMLYIWNLLLFLKG